MMKDNYVPMDAGARCAHELNDVPWETIRRCASGREGQVLLAEVGRETQALRPKASFIPTIVINGDQGDQRQILKNLAREICRAFKVVIIYIE